MVDYDYYRAYQDGELIAEGDTPVPEAVMAQAHEIHWLMKEQLLISPDDD